MLCEIDHPETRALLRRYLTLLQLPDERLKATTERRRFEQWLGRAVRASIGGAYVFLPATREHAILINLPRIDLTQSRALEVVVAEELIHMRDHLDGDRRRHAKHGYDRIARRVATLTGASMDEIRGALLPVKRRRLRYVYACPACDARFERRVRGVWSCGRCSRRFDPAFALRLVEDRGPMPRRRGA
jgi:predicted SprT family Zn-dependent metalloprotease